MSSGQLQLVSVAPRARDLVRSSFPRVLETKLEVLQPRVHQRRQPRFGEADAGSNQIHVESGRPCARDQFRQVRTRQGLTTGQV